MMYKYPLSEAEKYERDVASIRRKRLYGEYPCLEADPRTPNRRCQCMNCAYVRALVPYPR